MTWERRQRGGRYYYRTRWVDGWPVKEYVGGGLVGKLAAQLDEHERREREEEAAYWKREQERWRMRFAALGLPELEEAAKILTTACLIVEGCHKHNGEWRRLRESA
jgi:hypothetical protein